MRVADVMSRRVHTFSPSQSLREAAQLLSKHDISGAPVLDEEGRTLGYLSRTDLIDAMAKHGEIALLRVEDAMSREIVSVEPDATVEEAARTMVYEGVHRVVVRVGQGEPLGILSSLDALRAWLSLR
ncbi:MAG: CBS domain-containing protein [Myxococcales bacterium]|nr:CBS domain-containing protein [Polyangiaceae bacterium]MDW8250099.1 CBS domain-containing protein [Myxococcales bacterium]